MATIRTVADLAGTSTATVSHVINDTRVVSGKLAARVLDAMEQLDYHPDVVARSLRRRETLTIGLLAPSVEIPFFARVAEHIETAANDAGYSVILCNSGWSLHRERRHLHTLLARRIDGLLCLSLEMTADDLAPLLRHDTPVVMFERPMPGIALDAVEIDNFQGAYDAAAHLIALGHRRIACVTGLPHSNLNDTRIRGFRQALEGSGLPVDDALIRHGDYTGADGMRHAHALLDAAAPPSAIFALNDMMAMGILKVAHERGLRVPDDLAVIGFDGLPLTEFTSPPLSTVQQPVAAMSAAAIGMLLDRIRGTAPAEPRVKTFTATLAARASTVGYSSNSHSGAA